MVLFRSLLVLAPPYAIAFEPTDVVLGPDHEPSAVLIHSEPGPNLLPRDIAVGPDHEPSAVLIHQEPGFPILERPPAHEEPAHEEESITTSELQGESQPERRDTRNTLRASERPTGPKKKVVQGMAGG